MLWQGRHPQNLCPPTPFHCLLSNIYTRWCDSMQSTALAWIGSLELPMQSFCTHLPLPQTTSLVQLPAAVICEIPFKFGTYVRNRMRRTLSRTWVSTWICLLLGYINLLAGWLFHFCSEGEEDQWHKRTDDIVYSSNGRSAVYCLENISNKLTWLTIHHALIQDQEQQGRWVMITVCRRMGCQ